MQVGVSLQSADAVVLVFSVEDETSFTEVTRLRDLIHSYKGKHLPQSKTSVLLDFACKENILLHQLYII